MHDGACVQVPPLRVRPADIVDLERYFMRVLSKQKGVRLALTPEAERTLLGYSFPNNIVVRGWRGEEPRSITELLCSDPPFCSTLHPLLNRRADLLFDCCV
jgi:hypothetical protein